MKKGMKILGGIFIILGIFMIINGFISLTGAVIGIKGYFYNTTFILGISLIVIGILIFEFGKDERLEDVTESEADRLGLSEESEMTEKQRAYVEAHTPGHLKSDKPSWLYKTVRFLGRSLVKQVYGKENLPEGPALIISSHRAPIRETGYLLGALDNQVHIAAGERMNYNPWFSNWLFKGLGAVPLRESFSNYQGLTEEEKRKIIRGAPVTQKRAHREALEEADKGDKYSGRNINYVRMMTSLLMRGKKVAFFAEGPLTKLKDDPRKAYAGYALVAREYERQTGKKLPIVPMAEKPYGLRGEVVIGKPFYIDQKGKQPKQELKDMATERIHSLYDFLNQPRS